MYDVHLRIDVIHPVSLFWEFIHLTMYIIQIIPVQTCSLKRMRMLAYCTSGNAEEGSQFIQSRTSECDTPFLVCTGVTAMYEFNPHIPVIHTVYGRKCQR